jgi:hypothetical protein
MPCAEMTRHENERGCQLSTGLRLAAQSTLGCWKDVWWEECSDCAFRLNNTTGENRGKDPFGDKDDEGELRANKAQDQADAWCISRVVGAIERERGRQRDRERKKFFDLYCTSRRTVRQGTVYNCVHT